jgi:uncharacterized protein YlxW (UPF0749 family)
MQSRPHPGEHRSRAAAWGWRLSVPVACAFAGLLGVTSMINAHGTDLRGGRNTDLVQIVSSQRARVQQLRDETRSLQAQIDGLSKSVSGSKTRQLQRRLRRLEAPAGMLAMAGPGLTVTLDDAPRGEAPAGVDPNLLLVHQQDIQAVVNALWAGGAEAISLQGQRIIATTGIKCVGNSVVLQGVPYSPPYRIKAVGDSTTMYDALLASPEVRTYRQYVRPPYNLGWSLRASSHLEIPAFTASVTLDFAHPAVG